MVVHKVEEMPLLELWHKQEVYKNKWHKDHQLKFQHKTQLEAVVEVVITMVVLLQQLNQMRQLEWEDTNG
jgi:hypothetical protein